MVESAKASSADRRHPQQPALDAACRCMIQLAQAGAQKSAMSAIRACAGTQPTLPSPPMAGTRLLWFRTGARPANAPTPPTRRSGLLVGSWLLSERRQESPQRQAPQAPAQTRRAGSAGPQGPQQGPRERCPATSRSPAATPLRLCSVSAWHRLWASVWGASFVLCVQRVRGFDLPRVLCWRQQRAAAGWHAARAGFLAGG